MKRYTIFILAASLLTANWAWAYVPASDKILKAWFGVFEKLPQVSIQATVNRGAVTLPFTAEWKRNELTLMEAGRPVTDATTQLVWALLLRPSAGLQMLKDAGLNLERRGLAREHNRIAWTLGASGEAQPDTQLWLDRGDAAPVRAIVQHSGTLPASLIVYSGYHDTPGRIFPRRIEITGNGNTAVFLITDVQTGPAK